MMERFEPLLQKW